MPSQLTTDARTAAKGQLKAWHAFIWFAGFFGFMFAVNGIFLWTAIRTFPGEDVEKSYLTGLDYNRELSRKADQSGAGWAAEIGLSGQGPARVIRVRVRQDDGSPLHVSAPRLEMRHPADRNLDRSLEAAPVGDGEFVAPIGDLAPGLWKVQFRADVDPDRDGLEFAASRSLVVP